MSFSSSLKAVNKPLRDMLPSLDSTLTEDPTATAQAAYARLQVCTLHWIKQCHVQASEHYAGIAVEGTTKLDRLHGPSLRPAGTQP